MSWPRGSLVAALLVFSIPLASADTITVNTTTDDYADNALCSLREAVEYFNLDKPKDGFQGCKTDVSSSASIITVPANESPYKIGTRASAGVDYGALFVRRTLTISGAGTSDEGRTWIQVEGPHRAFIVSAERTIEAPACNLAGNCSPAGAPVLDPASDTDGAGNNDNDFLTPVTTPKFSGVLNPLPAGTVRVTLYRRLANADADSEPVALGAALVDGLGNWSVATTAPFSEGLHHVTYTVTVDGGEEGEESPATQLAVYREDGDAVTLSLSSLELQGCGEASGCANLVDTTPGPSNSYNGLVYDYPLSGTAGKGGVIYSNETLELSAVIIHDGVADGGLGGAIYAGESGLLGLTAVTLKDNTAADGAAIYAEKNSVFILQSLVTGNTSAGAAVAVASDDQVASSEAGKSQIINSTFSGNDAVALSLRAGAVVNTSTIVLNAGGIRFNNAKVSVYNTILAGNPDNFPAAASPSDCLLLSSDLDFQSSLGMTGGGCGNSTPGLSLISNNVPGQAGQKLMASSTAQGVCSGYVLAAGDAVEFEGMGLLCPLATRSEDETTASHLPRILGHYTSLANSPIVAKGSTLASGAGACPGNDQRAVERPGGADICDIGAVELQAVTAAVRSGDAISQGQTYTEALDSELDDEQLFMPTADTGAGSCPAFALTNRDPVNGDARKPGCPWITIAPSKGTVVFNADGTYTYRPSSNFHGFDRFSFRVVTTLSKLNGAFDSQSRVVNAQVVVEPEKGLTAYSTSGAADLSLLLSLAGLGLAGWQAGRRKKP
jgi:rhombotarget A family protien